MLLKPLYIFDLDGTLALIAHRTHLVDKARGKPDWKGFYRSCVDDEPNAPVIRIMELLRASGADVWIFSGRSDKVREQTIDWLTTHTSFTAEELHGSVLTMRRASDYTPDDELKRSWLNNMLAVDRQRLQCTFDDRERVVRMWRDAGVICLQVAEGDF